ncbi:hypothetical protein [Parvularcula lutaonensis]|uniref:Lipoprotein n=1 Tax=Parvularcula lutaonensis TaxID=491923 RepID=A0ABV7MFM1_9PROT|nr:hypothetical protein [Parvularcula lutaonensis]GGY53414.1 hypothetical protein GCM10007148_23320 [Parvularcula lutaonensis]
MLKALLPLTAVALLAACATTEGTTTGSAETTQTAETSKEALICKGETTTGSRLRKKPVCRTAEEWRTISETSGDLISQRREINQGREGSLSPN